MIKYILSDIQQQYISWGLLVFIIIVIVTITVSAFNNIDQDTFNTNKQKEQCGDSKGIMVYTYDMSYRCFTKEIILKNYYDEYVK